jgi:calcium-dependent protein kinase
MKRFSASGLEMLDNEIEILRKLNHPNVIKLHYVHRANNFTYLVT